MRTPKIIAVVCSSLFLYVVGTVLAVPALFFMAAAVLGSVLASYLLSRMALRGLTLACRGFATGHEDQVVRFPVTLRNSGRVPRFQVTVEPELPAGLACVSGGPQLFVPIIPANGHCELELAVRLQQRGCYHLTHLRLSALDPLGMFGSSRRFPAGTEVLVYPQIVPLATPVFAGVAEPEAAEVCYASPTPRGDEFHGVREYVPGDELRRIHWKSTARHTRFHVMEFDQPTTDSMSIILDASKGTDAGGGRESTFEYGCRLAASLLADCRQRGAVGRLSVTADAAPSRRRSLGRSGSADDWYGAALGELARARPTAEVPLDGAVSELAADATADADYVILASSLSTRLPQATRILMDRAGPAAVVLFDASTFATDANIPPASDLTAELLSQGVDVIVLECGDSLSDCLASRPGGGAPR